MSGEQRKYAKSGASTDRTAAQHDEETNRQTEEGNTTGATVHAPLVRFDTSLRASAKSQVSNEMLRK